MARRLRPVRGGRPCVRSAAKNEGKLYKSRQPHRIRGGGGGGGGGVGEVGDCNLGKRSQVRNGKLFRKIEFGLKCGIETCILLALWKLDSQRAEKMFQMLSPCETSFSRRAVMKLGISHNRNRMTTIFCRQFQSVTHAVHMTISPK